MNLVQSYEMQSILVTGDVFIDVGANLGSYTIPLAQHVGPLGTVISFEPFRWLYQMLNANVAANGLMNCWTYQVALSDEPTRLSLMQPNLRYFSSPGGVRYEDQPTNFSSESVRQMYDTEWGNELVDAWRLDDIVQTSSPPFARRQSLQVDLIKIDVEGMELRVLKGAIRVLKELKPIVWVENVAFFDKGDRTFLNWMQIDMGYVCHVSSNAGNDFVCEPGDGSRRGRLNRVGLKPSPSDSR
jgi:FkbM family methyltransferase